MLDHKTSLNKFKKTNHIKHLFWPQWYENRNYTKKTGKFINTWRSNNILLNNQWVKEEIKREIKKYLERASLVAQWLRIRLPMRGTRVRALVREDPTCHRATKPVRHNYWACTLELTCHNYWACMPQLLKPMCLEPVLCNKRSHCNEKPTQRNEE